MKEKKRYIWNQSQSTFVKIFKARTKKNIAECWNIWCNKEWFINKCMCLHWENVRHFWKKDEKYKKAHTDGDISCYYTKIMSCDMQIQRFCCSCRCCCCSSLFRFAFAFFALFRSHFFAILLSAHRIRPHLLCSVVFLI